MLFNYFVYTIFFLYGIIIGSFLNVCIYRIPKSESIVTNRSHCMSCGYHLKWYDLIPIASFLALRGRCRSCGEKISIQYPFVELINGVIYVFIITARGGLSFTSINIRYDIISILYCLTASALIVLSFIDFRTYEIPVKLNYLILFFGLIGLGLDSENWSLHIIGFFTVSTVLYILHRITRGSAIGGGDVRLMAAGGLLLGPKCIVIAFILACIVGSVIHLLRMKISHADHVLAMGPYLSVGILISMVYGDQLWNWYLNTFIR